MKAGVLFYLVITTVAGMLGLVPTLYVERTGIDRVKTSYRGGRPNLEAVFTDLVRRLAPRLIAYLEEYQEAIKMDFASQG